MRVGIIRPKTNREYAGTITSTGSSFALPSSSGIFRGGNHKSHCAASPGSQTRQSAGSARRSSGRNRRTLSRNQLIDPDHPTRSAITVAGIRGNSASRARTRGSNGENDVGCSDRSYFGGLVDVTALATVDLPPPKFLATCRCGTPSATSLLINTQSSKVITHPICLGGLIFKRRYGLVLERRRKNSGRLRPHLETARALWA